MQAVIVMTTAFVVGGCLAACVPNASTRSTSAQADNQTRQISPEAVTSTFRAAKKIDLKKHYWCFSSANNEQIIRRQYYDSVVPTSTYLRSGLLKSSWSWSYQFDDETGTLSFWRNQTYKVEFNTLISTDGNTLQVGSFQSHQCDEGPIWNDPQ